MIRRYSTRAFTFQHSSAHQILHWIASLGELHLNYPFTVRGASFRVDCMTTLRTHQARNSQLAIVGSLAAALLLTGCSAPAPAEEAGGSSTAQGEPTEQVAVSEPEMNDRIIYGIASDAGEWGLYSSKDGIDWEIVAPLPDDFDGRTSLGPGTVADSVVYYDGKEVSVLSAASDWESVGTSSYSYNSGTWSVKPRAYAAEAWWSFEAGGLWTSMDAMTWELSYDQVDEFQNFRDGVAADDALPNGELYGNGQLLLIPHTAQRGTTSLLRPVDMWDELTLPVWVSTDGQSWERHETEVAGDAPGEVAGDLQRDHYLWDGARWLWQADDALYAAEDTGDKLVFELVSEITAGGETPTAEIAAAGDLIVVPATNANPKTNDSGSIVGGTVLVSTDGGQTWALHETDVLVNKVATIIEE